jgi:hypothetical protein
MPRLWQRANAPRLEVRPTGRLSAQVSDCLEALRESV